MTSTSHSPKRILMTERMLLYVNIVREQQQPKEFNEFIHHFSLLLFALYVVVLSPHIHLSNNSNSLWIVNTIKSTVDMIIVVMYSRTRRETLLSLLLWPFRKCLHLNLFNMSVLVLKEWGAIDKRQKKLFHYLTGIAKHKAFTDGCCWLKDKKSLFYNPSHKSENYFFWLKFVYFAKHLGFAWIALISE